MTSLRLTDREWATAKDVCTERQVLALDLWRRGAGYRRIGDLLDIDESTARQHVKRGRRRLELELERQAA